MDTMTNRHDELRLGIAEMDTEHFELADLFDAFQRTVNTRTPAADVHNLVRTAIERANAHFEHEEKLIEKSGYPAANDHKFQHRHMRLQFTTLVGDAVTFKLRDATTLQNLATLRRILIEHITGPDKDLAAFLKSAGYK